MASPFLGEEQPEEKDSLFSDEEPEVTEKIDTEEVIAEEPLPEYTEAELDKLVGYVRKITTLYDLRETDWTEENYAVIKDFISNPKEPVLTVYFEEDTLRCLLDFPETPIVDLTYFYRESNEIFQVDTFHDQISFGTVDDSVEGSILKILESIYSPIFFNITTWPDSVKSDFCARFHMFLAKLTDLHHKMLGLTVIYIPKEGLDLPVEVASKDKELVKRLEGIVVYWTRQIRVVLQDQDQNTPDDLLCPVDEYEFWIYRYENLTGLNHQLTNKNLRHICDILASVQSIYVKQFMTLAEEINKNLIEVKSNIEYLQILKIPCSELRSISSPEDIPAKLSRILNMIRFIWENSPYYNTEERVTTICRALTNQIIIQCSEHVELDVVFKARHSRKAMKMFQTCIDCCIKYIQIYTLVSEAHTELTPKPWKLDKAPIFNHLDSYIQRCKDMIEICEAMMTFGRFDETEEIPKPRFSGSRGEEFEKWCEKVESMFEESLEDVEVVQHLILNVQTSEWYDEILKFRGRMKDIEIVIENLVNSVFEQIPTLEEGVEAMGAFYNYSQRDSLKGLFERKTLFVFQLFRQEIQNCKQDLVQEQEEYPAHMPYYSGRALMAQMKKSHLKISRKILEAAAWLPACSIADDVFLQYDNLITSIDEMIMSIYRKFVDSIGEDMTTRLNSPLMCRSATKPGLLECNMDRSILQILEEIKYWTAMKFEIPQHISALSKRQESLRFIYENVLQVVMDYNKILASLSDEERLLFRQPLYVVEKKIAPGLSKLTWLADIGDEYIAECSACTAELQDFLDDYKTCNYQMVAICEKICDTPIINLQISQAYDLRELIMDMYNYRNKTISELVKHYQDIVRYIIVVYEGFESHMANMADNWVKYMCKFDMLLEESIRVCVKNSLQNMFEALHGDGTTGPNPILRLEANLKQIRINFEPSLSDVAYFISDMLPSITNTLHSLPRLVDKFQISVSEILPFHQIIENDTDCRDLQEMLNDEVKVNVLEIQDYMKTWEPFRDMWEVDKDKFIERYELEKPNATQFDANIGRYMEVINNVQIQETIASVHFILVNSSDLKRSTTEHCVQWQNKLCDLLYKLTINKINHVYEYTRTNAEKVMTKPTNLKEMQESVELFERLREEVPAEEEEFPSISEQIVILDKYKVALPPDILSLERHIPDEWRKYLEMLDEAEKMIGYAKVIVNDMKASLRKSPTIEMAA